MSEGPENPREAGDHLLEESLEDLYERAPCGYFSTRPDGAFIRVNQTLLDWLGYRRDELLAGMRFVDVLTIPGKIYHETHYFPLLQMQGFVNELAFDFVCRDGRRLPVLINTVQITDESGRPRVNRSAVFNSSHRRLYERELQAARKKAEQALRVRDQFLAVASHELKTPLTSILGHIQLLKRRLSANASLSERDARSMQLINDQAQRLNAMVMSLLDTSRIETGQLSIMRAPVEVYTLICRVVDEVRLAFPDRAVHVECPGPALIVQGDELRLEQVFQNLIQNALKYSAHDAPVRVTVRQHGATVDVAVRDRGIGIPEASLPHLFDRFYRATNVQDAAVTGMGIGLYVVKEIVELHGGQVGVESVEGQGSTFTVSLPLDTGVSPPGTTHPEQ